MSETQRHPCGHVEMSRGCGGCDPGAIEFVRDDFGPWRKARDCRDDGEDGGVMGGHAEFVEYRPMEEAGNLCHWRGVPQHMTGPDCPCGPARTKFPAGSECGQPGHTQGDVKIAPSGRTYCRPCRRAHEKRRKAARRGDA